MRHIDRLRRAKHHQKRAADETATEKGGRLGDGTTVHGDIVHAARSRAYVDRCHHSRVELELEVRIPLKA